MKEKLLVIVGPTAVGKTDLSIEIAKAFNGEIISGDSMQVYKGMDIGTAKINHSEMQGVPHYLIDCFEPDHYFSVAEFQELATEKITDINNRGKLPIIVGGTGLYIKSITHKYNFPNATNNEAYREKLYELIEKEGKEALYQKLAVVDPRSAQRLHINDTKRIIRALEIFHVTGKSMSELLDQQSIESTYELVMIGLTMDREKLYNRINIRVDKMLDDGLVDEVQGLLNKGFDEKYNSMQGIGYKEILQYIRGEIELENAINSIKQGTRRFAKRQLSWFRQMEEINWFDMTNDDYQTKNKIKDNIYNLIAGKFTSLKN